MNLVKIFFRAFVVIVIGWGLFFVYISYSDNGALETEIENHLLSIAQSKADRVSNFLEERKNDLAFLATSVEVKEIFSKNSVNISSDMNETLSFFQETNNYLDLILISPEGKVLWTSKQKELIDSDLSVLEDGSNKLAAIYKKVSKDFGVGIFAPDIIEPGKQLSVYVTTPVLVDSPDIPDKKEIIGLIALQIDNNQIEKLISSEVGISEFGETYIVNRERNNITPIESSGSNNQIKSDQIDRCFIDYDNYYISHQGEEVEAVEKNGSYKNYADAQVFGAHQYVLRSSWCVLSEVSQDKFFKTRMKANWPKIRSSLYLLILISSLGLFAVLALGKHYQIKEKQ